jgi:AraC family transcriptional regulator of arabinose operon
MIRVPDVGWNVDPRVLKVTEIMSSNLHRHLPIGSIAASVNLSYSRLEHLFKAETGVTPVSYLKRLRIERARELLETTFLTNQQILIKVGMYDESYFVKEFKKTYGLRPTEYRKRHHATLNKYRRVDEKIE